MFTITPGAFRDKRLAATICVTLIRALTFMSNNLSTSCSVNCVTCFKIAIPALLTKRSMSPIPERALRVADQSERSTAIVWIEDISCLRVSGILLYLGLLIKDLIWIFYLGG